MLSDPRSATRWCTVSQPLLGCPAGIVWPVVEPQGEPQAQICVFVCPKYGTYSQNPLVHRDFPYSCFRFSCKIFPDLDPGSSSYDRAQGAWWLVPNFHEEKSSLLQSVGFFSIWTWSFLGWFCSRQHVLSPFRKGVPHPMVWAMHTHSHSHFSIWLIFGPPQGSVVAQSGDVGQEFFVIKRGTFHAFVPW